MLASRPKTVLQVFGSSYTWILYPWYRARDTCKKRLLGHQPSSSATAHMFDSSYSPCMKFTPPCKPYTPFYNTTPHTCVYKALQAHKSISGFSFIDLFNTYRIDTPKMLTASRCLSRRHNTVFESFSQLQQTAQHLLDYTHVTSPSSSHIPAFESLQRTFHTLQ